MNGFSKGGLLRTFQIAHEFTNLSVLFDDGSVEDQKKMKK